MTGRTLFKALWPVLRRGRGSVQFGTDLSHARVVEGLRADEVEALQLLDGTRELPAALQTPAGRDLLCLLLAQRLVVDAAQPVPQPPAARTLLAHDTQAVLRTAPTQSQAYAVVAARHAAHLLVAGRGDLPRIIAEQLRRAGVGSVRHGAEVADDWGQQGAHPDGSGDRPPPPRGWRDDSPAPSLVVLVGSGAVDSVTARPWRARGIPVLPVVLHGVEAVVGPVVVPDGPCLRCLDLARAELDPAWPALLGQLVPVAVGAGPEVSGETTLVTMAAAMAAMVALAVLDGHAVPTGRSLELSLPWPAVRQRQWEVHPRCRCAARSDTSGRPADGGASSQAMMAG